MATNIRLEGDQLYDLVEAEQSSLSVDEDNLAKASVTYTGRWPYALAQALQISSHPDFSGLVRKGLTVTRESPQLAVIELSFEGVVSEDEDVATVTNTYALRSTAATEPIETHPNFDKFAGKPGAALDEPNDKGAFFDKHGRFGGFVVEKVPQQYYPDLNRNKAGVRNYLAPGVVYEERATYNELAVATIAVDLNAVGDIDVPPNSSILPDVRGRDWIMAGASIEEAGDGIRVTRTWRMSGKRGWDRDIYTRSARG